MLPQCGGKFVIDWYVTPCVQNIAFAVRDVDGRRNETTERIVGYCGGSK